MAALELDYKRGEKGIVKSMCEIFTYDEKVLQDIPSRLRTTLGIRRNLPF